MEAQQFGLSLNFLEYYPLIANFICSKMKKNQKCFYMLKDSNLKSEQSLYFTNILFYTKCAPLFFLKIEKDFNIDDQKVKKT